MIKTLKICNFKCFKEQSINFGNMTLLTGLNGMGKSSVIQSLLLLRQSFKQGVLPNEGLALNGSIVNIGTGQDALSRDADKFNIEFEINFKDSKSAKWVFDYNQSADVLPLLSTDIDDEVYRKNLFMERFFYVEAERLGPRRFFEMSAYNVKKLHQTGSKSEYALHYLSHWGDNKVSNFEICHPDSNGDTIFNQVEAWMQEIRPGTQIHLSPRPEMDLLNLNYSFKREGHSSDKFRSTNVGFGITYILPVLLALIAANPGDLVILENPEAHLHPKGQAKLGELMAIAAHGGVQVIVESHSDHILNGIRFATYIDRIQPDEVCINYFENSTQEEASQVEVITPIIDSEGRLDKWPSGFFDVWDDYLEKLLTPKEYLKS